jgi:hypothetical protein
MGFYTIVRKDAPVPGTSGFGMPFDIKESKRIQYRREGCSNPTRSHVNIMLIIINEFLFQEDAL